MTILAEVQPIIIQLDLTSGGAIGGGIVTAFVAAAKMIVSYMKTRDDARDKENGGIAARLEMTIQDQKLRDKEIKDDNKQASIATLAMSREMITAMVDMKNAVISVDAKVVDVGRKMEGLPCTENPPARRKP